MAFDHEKLDVYQVELQFVAWVTPLLEEVRNLQSASTAEVRDQLDRASISMLLNTAEGKQLLIRIVSMLSKMVELFSGDGTVREEAGEYIAG